MDHSIPSAHRRETMHLQKNSPGGKMYTRTTSNVYRPRHDRQFVSMHRAAISSHQLFLLVLSLSILIATHVRVVRSYAIVPNPPLVLPKSTYTLTKSTAPQTTTKQYSLGIRSSSDNETTDDIIRATQYWVEYESVNEFPSPRQQLPVQLRSDTSKSSVDQPVTTNEIKGKTKKQHPPLIPSRLTDDKVLKIVSQNQREEQYVVKAIAHPTMRSGHDFDINTAWIELLIHEQQMKLSSTMDKVEVVATTV